MQLQTAVDEFLLACGADGLSRRTLIWYGSLLKKFTEAFGDRDLDSLSVSELRTFLVNLRQQGKYSEDTLHDHGRALRRFFNWSSREYEMASNPMDRIKATKQPKPKMPKAVNAADVVKLLAVCDASTTMGKRNRAVIAFLMDTGCRAAGVCGLTMNDLDLEQGRAYVIEKGSKRRVVFFSEVTAHFLREWLAVRNPDSPYVFYGHTGERLRSNGLTQLFDRLKARAGVTGRVNPHAFRHGFARDYIKNGGDLATLSRILGHESQEVTALYYAVFEADELKAAHEKFSPMKKLRSVIEDADDTLN